MTTQELIDRTRKFALRVFKLVDKLPRSQASKVISYKLLRAASSVAAKYRAVRRAKSDADFANKVRIVLEEADESDFWISFIADLQLLPQEEQELRELLRESDELVAIFTATSKTLTRKLGR